MGQMIVLTNAVDGRDDEFNRWYDEVHLGEVLALGPFVAASRFRLADAQVMPDQPHRYVALYEFDGDPQAAIDALMAGAATFDMSDAMAGDQMVMLYEPIGERVTA